MSNKELLKASLVEQLLHDKETILPLLIEPNPQKWSGVYFSNIYRKVSRYVCTEHQLDIVFRCEYINELNINVQLAFEEYEDESRNSDELRFIDVSHRDFMQRPFVREILEFKNNEMIITLNYFEVAFRKDNKFIKISEGDMMTCVYNFQTKAFSNTSAELMMRTIPRLRGDGENKIYVDTVLTNTIEQAFRNEISRDCFKGKEYVDFRKKLTELNPTNKESSTAMQLLDYIVKSN